MRQCSYSKEIVLLRGTMYICITRCDIRQKYAKKIPHSMLLEAKNEFPPHIGSDLHVRSADKCVQKVLNFLKKWNSVISEAMQRSNVTSFLSFWLYSFFYIIKRTVVTFFLRIKWREWCSRLLLKSLQSWAYCTN